MCGSKNFGICVSFVYFDLRSASARVCISASWIRSPSTSTVYCLPCKLASSANSLYSLTLLTIYTVILAWAYLVHDTYTISCINKVEKNVVSENKNQNFEVRMVEYGRPTVCDV